VTQDAAAAVHEVPDLSPRQREVLRVIIAFRRDTGEFPSVEYLSRRLEVHHSSVQGHLAALYRKGWLRTPTPAGLRCLHLP
jgi:Mn-dependent DtxR family transcriptional regulator